MNEIAKKKMVLRLVATGLMFSLGCFYALSVLGNLTDYDYNYDFVKIVLTMQGVPAHAGVAWRAVQSPILITLAFWAVILTETVISIVAFWGAVDLLRYHRKSDDEFAHGKIIALLATSIGICLYFFGYLVIGDQWFRAWMSSAGEDVESTAFMFNAFMCFMFIILRLTP